MKAIRASVLILAIVATPVLACASGTLRGSVSAEDGGDRLSGANVLLLGTTIGATTDLDGEYLIEDVPAGTYEVRASFEGYDSRILSDAVIKDGETTKLIIKLERRGGAAASFTIDDLVVTADRVKSTEVALITERMKSITIGDAISAERISKSPDGSGSDVLKRVTGLSVVDNKFVFVRGVTDRYSVTWLDGVPVSSTDTDVDRRSFTYDILPASLLSSAVIVKTATPDLPGDFTGGLVTLNTRDIPTERGLSVSASSGYDEGTTGSEMRRSQGGSSDRLGMDDGKRKLPHFEESAGNNYNELLARLPNSWHTPLKKAPLNGSYSLSYGDRFDLGGNDGRHVVGLVAGLKYSESYDLVEFVESPRDTGGYELYHKEGTKSRYKVDWSALMNLAYTPAPGHQLSLRGLYMQDARDQVTYAEGSVSQNSGPGGRSYAIEWDERSRYGLQLGGSHEFGRRSGPSLEWKVFGSESTAYEPDRKQADFQLRADGTRSLSENSRSWSDLGEHSSGFRADLRLPLGRSEVKFGSYVEHRDRDYRTSSFVADTGTIRPPNYWIRVAGIDTIFVADNFGARKMTFRMKTAYTGEYDASHDIEAYYGMFVSPFSIVERNFRFAGGARIEHSDQSARAIKKEGLEEPVLSRIDKTDVLPSVSLTYMPSEWMNVRVAHFQSVNRPELREMADVKYYDFNEANNVVGNPDLERALIKNYDVRIEAFPASDEVIAVSYFFKDMYDAIEIKLIPSSDYKYLKTWFNSPRGRNHGFEVELKKSLGFVGGFLDDFTVIANYARVYSSVEYLYEWRYQDEDGNWHTGRETRTRPLQGQSPWTLNLGLLYENERLGTSVSVLYNRIARRLNSVAGDREGDLWDEPRDIFDLALTQKVLGRFEVKFTAKNLTESASVKTMGPHRILHTREAHGRSVSLALGLKL